MNAIEELMARGVTRLVVHLGLFRSACSDLEPFDISDNVVGILVEGKENLEAAIVPSLVVAKYPIARHPKRFQNRILR